MSGYGTDQGFADYLAAQGLTLPDDAPPVAVLLQAGSSYVDAAYEHRLQCSQRADGFDQELAWPRRGHKMNGHAVPVDFIPTQWIEASYRAAYLQGTASGWTTSGSDPGRQVRRQKVDVIEREFFAPGEAAGSQDIAPGMPFDAVINALVAPWLCSNARGPSSLFRVI